MTEFHSKPRDILLASTPEIIDEARNGRMFILVDDEDRENEGDLVIPAQMATPTAINFMATHGRGLICLALDRKRVEQLGLDLMSPNNGTRHETAFTVSIEARAGVSTGISAADRARTVAVAIDGTKGPEHIVTPGHVFPLIARPGGVLVRAGHTEAAVDVARLAGLNPSGVICEIMNDDGTMARLDDLIDFAKLHGLKIGTIRDLIAYRRRHDHDVERLATARIESRWGGEWTAISFRNKAVQSEAIALVKGRIDPSAATLVRIHALDIFADVLGQADDRSDLLSRAMEEIAREGNGVVVLFSRDVPMSRLLRVKAGEPLVDRKELRDYGVGAQVLAELGIHDMILLTNSRNTPVALEGYGLNILERRGL
ncbi:3,4-dihydroxy-2-butanone-4-phosphate synthase [Rhizorhabdus wittichii]|uniref:3,4-dihydroxy-2-butanone-4-phosphate synthase n=1 Tax=Rhizorhabdus wittichii TaxID=160791 RepID=UPI000497E407|nr:3,4-dihydroxy-2-butanone-4-phosphate synthase [Rhizorhabdus wittichii]